MKRRAIMMNPGLFVEAPLFLDELFLQGHCLSPLYFLPFYLLVVVE
jgi:hypothetical protein|uniref:Uncharacterized protein n=1 Tax=Picea sitchensis TaxID=3332 RepID=A0A6B9XTA9_PICSI|nr:hypothetical protein Q903MT_gene4296 [Picea sitchensis]